MDKTLVISDLDGTLLNSNSEISLFTEKHLNQCIQDGLIFSYATARSIHSAKALTKSLDLKHPVITYNGGFIIDSNTHQIYTSTYFEQGEIEVVKKVCEQHCQFPLVYTYIEGIEKVLRVINTETTGVNFYLNNRMGDKRFEVVDNFEEIFRGEIFYFTLIDIKENLLPIY